MTMNKIDAVSFLDKLEERIREKLGGGNRMGVHNDVMASGKSEPEGVFVKKHLVPVIKDFLKDNHMPEEYFNFEGNFEVSGKHMQKQKSESFFSSTPAPDFEIDAPNNFYIVGECKYTSSPAAIMNAIGQTICYKYINEIEKKKPVYGLVVFFNKPKNNKQKVVDAAEQPKEKAFVSFLRREHNIFLVII